ncbi:hypothetical protein NDU88_010986 [Pleurodeles waltl]|uniref:Uncharacterized protein n=1 Tax=Pleurodeles waltl TaxID=8319 RepID=A0AAV7PZE8_PLEWA|nr:hypothetical protein NDU88_010986 [Pleurodeles waltl]
MDGTDPGPTSADSGETMDGTHPGPPVLTRKSRSRAVRVPLHRRGGGISHIMRGTQPQPSGPQHRYRAQLPQVIHHGQGLSKCQRERESRFVLK